MKMKSWCRLPSGKIIERAMGGPIPGRDQGIDTVPAMLRGGEFVLRPEAVALIGRDNLHRINALAPQHFATGGSVDPYDPTNPAKTQDWTQQLDPTGQLPAGYSSYTQGFNPLTQKWEYNPNTGQTYTGGDVRGVAAPAAAPTNALAPGAPAAGDPNYYKYTSVGGAAYKMPAAPAPTPAANPPSNPAVSSSRSAGTTQQPPANPLTAAGRNASLPTAPVTGTPGTVPTGGTQPVGPQRGTPTAYTPPPAVPTSPARNPSVPVGSQFDPNAPPPVTPPANTPPPSTPPVTPGTPGAPGSGVNPSLNPPNNALNGSFYPLGERPQYQYPTGVYAKPFSYDQVSDFTQNPGYQAQLKETENALKRRLLASGRLNSDAGLDAYASNARNLAGTFEQQAYSRALGEYTQNYNQAYQQDVRDYSRAMAEDALTYSRYWNENDREYQRILNLATMGQSAATTSSQEANQMANVVAGILQKAGIFGSGLITAGGASDAAMYNFLGSLFNNSAGVFNSAYQGSQNQPTEQGSGSLFPH